MRIADSHLHLFENGYHGLYGPSLFRPDIDVYEQLRAVHGIERGLVVGYEGQGMGAGNNAYVRSLAVEHPWMASVAYLDARTMPSARSVSGLLADGHVGIAVYIGEAGDAEAVAAWPAEVWRLLDERRALISVNAPVDFIPGFVPIVEESPSCAFLFSHLGMPGSFRTPPARAEAAERLAPLLRASARHNVFAKISGLYAISDPAHDYPHHAAAPFIEVMLESLGPERCLWGSDFSPALDHISFAQTVSYPWLDDLNQGECAQVMGENLIALLEQVRSEDR